MTNDLRSARHIAGDHEACLKGECDVAVEMVTITLPAALVRAVDEAWHHAYHCDRTERRAAFEALAEAYSYLRDQGVNSLNDRWLSRALVDARAYASDHAREW